MRLLLVEDEARLGTLLQATLTDAGFAVDRVNSLADARDALRPAIHDVVLLDRGLPDGDGLTLVAELRASRSETPVLIMTARDAVIDRVAGLDAGADDYLVKPFASEEMLARLRALLRRPGGALGRRLTAGSVTFDSIERVVCVAGVPIGLPRHELAALECLLRRAGRVVTKDTLIEQLYACDDEPASNAVPVHIHNLRRKLDAANAGVDIITFRGLGYMLKSQP
jgi:DNA-binding response OmpR family regulator